MILKILTHICAFSVSVLLVILGCNIASQSIDTINWVFNWWALGPDLVLLMIAGGVMAWSVCYWE